MRGGVPRRWLEVGGWLLTPIVAWAVAFLGGWGGALAGNRLRSPTAGLALIVVGALLGAALGAFGWAAWIRRRSVPGAEREPMADDHAGT